DMDEKELKKEWLKHKFGSYEYNEELLKLHEAYLQILKRHWAKPEIQQRYPDIYKKMLTPVLYSFDMISKPGEISRDEWGKRSRSMSASSISYNFGRGLGDMAAEFDEYAGMSKEERDRLNVMVGKMLDMCHNIQYTVDNRWNDRLDILNEDYTGPIDYPANWKEEICVALGLSTDSTPRGIDARCEAKQPCPRTGFWWTPAKQHSRRYFNQGDIMPDFPDSPYGATVWYWDQHQG
ncbi:MAG TPA: hypothetical protein VGE12_05265, partial [Noviherbaspirillum sp.]